MKNILITGGTVFVSKYFATYFQKKGYNVFVLNRGTRLQVDNVTLITADRNNLNNCLKHYYFDCIIDVCAYNKADIENLLKSVGEFKDYIFISSSAVYPETNIQPFSENQKTGLNKIWGDYGTKKIEAEEYLMSNVQNAYILRPPYIYGSMNNLYREAFVFDCAVEKRKFYIPNDGKMKLQFFHIDDLCKIAENILLKHPEEHILNVGNENTINVNTFVELCYQVVGTKLEKVYISSEENQRNYFSFTDYEFSLNIELQSKILPETMPMLEGLKQSYAWYLEHQQDILKKDYIKFIDENLSSRSV